VFVWELANRLQLTHELHGRILQALRENRIEIPFPRRDVHLRGESVEQPSHRLGPDQR
jgi:potassium efflux system protein